MKSDTKKREAIWIGLWVIKCYKMNKMNRMRMKDVEAKMPRRHEQGRSRGRHGELGGRGKWNQTRCFAWGSCNGSAWLAAHRGAAAWCSLRASQQSERIFQNSDFLTEEVVYQAVWIRQEPNDKGQKVTKRCPMGIRMNQASNSSFHILSSQFAPKKDQCWSGSLKFGSLWVLGSIACHISAWVTSRMTCFFGFF